MLDVKVLLTKMLNALKECYNPSSTCEILTAGSSTNYIAVPRPHNAVSGKLVHVSPLGLPTVSENVSLTFATSYDFAYFSTASLANCTKAQIMGTSTLGEFHWTY